MTETILKYFLCLLFFAALLPNIQGCTGEKTIPEEKFVKIYVDLILAEDSLSQKISSIDSLRSEILKRHNATESEYFATISYYNEDPVRWEGFFDRTVSYLENLKQSEQP